ncbi:hypothetical protein FE257_010711 [Aspergillus nanangensis]|uniref:Uncharacterized protein n=1 Tax=Aspergillus nanangensis TaxID=2582783 RepID=A0AAD4CI88_ASPNN|nr:hypothetical protein FE257_010711 [Aspergillus nanangensis]
MHDVSYFISGALDPVDRRTHERDLLRAYLSALHNAGGPALTIDDVWDHYRRHLLHGYFWALTPCEMQGRERVRAMGIRHLTAVLDHSSLELLEKANLAV